MGVVFLRRGRYAVCSSLLSLCNYLMEHVPDRVVTDDLLNGLPM